MAIGTPVEVSPVTGTTATTLTKTLGAGEAIAGGLAIYVQLSIRSNGNPTGISVTDDALNTYTLAVQGAQSDQEHIFIYRCTDCTALAVSDEITASWSSPSQLTSSLMAMSVSGIASSPADQSNSNGANSATTTSGTITPTTGERLVIGGMTHRRNDRIITEDSDFTNLTSTSVSGADQSQSSQAFWGYIVDTWDGLTGQDRVDTASSSVFYAAAIISEQAAAAATVGDNIAAHAAERRKVARLLRM